MNNKMINAGRRFEVVCSWCGDVIRYSERHASKGMCPKCFQRMVEENTRAHQQGGAWQKASER